MVEALIANAAGREALTSVATTVSLRIAWLGKGARVGGVGVCLSGELLASAVFVGVVGCE